MRGFAREAAFWLVHRKDSFYHYVGFVAIRYDPHISWLPWAPLRIPTAMADKLDTEASPSRSPTPDASVSRTTRARFIIGTTYRTVVQHMRKHVGVGIVCAVAYFDPYVLCIPSVAGIPNSLTLIPFARGNWSVDLQAGSNFGYRPMLFVLLMAGLGAIVLQVCFIGIIHIK